MRQEGEASGSAAAKKKDSCALPTYTYNLVGHIAMLCLEGITTNILPSHPMTKRAMEILEWKPITRSAMKALHGDSAGDHWYGSCPWLLTLPANPNWARAIVIKKTLSVVIVYGLTTQLTALALCTLELRTDISIDIKLAARKLTLRNLISESLICSACVGVGSMPEIGGIPLTPKIARGRSAETRTTRDTTPSQILT